MRILIISPIHHALHVGEYVENAMTLPSKRLDTPRVALDEGTEGHGKKNQYKNVPEVVKSMAKPITLEQIGPYKGFKCISYAYAYGNQEWSTIEEVNQKRSHENSWPKTIPKKKQCGNCDP